MPEHIWKDVADPAKFANDKPVGTGPFTELVNFRPSRTSSTRTRTTGRQASPPSRASSVTAYAGNEQQAAAMVAGDIDWTGSVLPNIDQAVIAKNPDMTYNPNPSGMTVLMHLNPNDQGASTIRSCARP